MEKKKLLLIAISVGLFLVITIGAAIFAFAPRSTAAPAMAVTSRHVPGTVTGIIVPPPNVVDSPAQAANPQPAPLDAVELVRKPDDVPGLKPAPEGTVQEGGFYVSGAARPGENAGAVVLVPKPNSAAIPDTPAPKKAAPAPVKRPAPAAAVPAAQSAGQSKAPIQTRVYDDYWIQTGAFSTVANAEGVKQTLASRGIASIIENRDLDGKTLFRVRVGPYTSQNEADYWLSLIKSIKGFEDSQIRLSQSRR